MANPVRAGVGLPLDDAYQFAEQESRLHKIAIEDAHSALKAVQEDEVTNTCTSAPDPVPHGGRIGQGMHINATESSIAATYGMYSAATVMLRLFVDRREPTVDEAGARFAPKQQGALDGDQVEDEIEEILLGRSGRRRSQEEVTLLGSWGLPMEDIVLPRWGSSKAVERHVPVRVEIGGTRHRIR